MVVVNEYLLLLVTVFVISVTVYFITHPDVWNPVTCGAGDVVTASDSVVLISGEAKTGTGFWVDSGLILTNFHVVSYNPNLTVSVFAEDKYRDFEAHVVGTDTIRDFALLKVEAVDGMPLKWAQNEPYLADPVFMIGYPQGLTLMITQGIISSFYQDDKTDDRVYIATDATINSGNSGGPLVNQCGEVVGLTTSAIQDSGNIGFATAYWQVKDRLQALITQSRTATPSDVYSNYPSDKAEVVAQYYDAISQNELDAAYGFYSSSLKSKTNIDSWKAGYDNTYFVQVTSLVPIEGTDEVTVNLTSTDWNTSEEPEAPQFLTKNYSGTWKLVKEGGSWRLNESSIKEVPAIVNPET